jgi:hypothetical protein
MGVTGSISKGAVKFDSQSKGKSLPQLQPFLKEALQTKRFKLLQTGY